MSSFDEGSGDETGALVPSGGSGRRQQLVRLLRLEWALAVREHPPLTPRVCARDRSAGASAKSAVGGVVSDTHVNSRTVPTVLWSLVARTLKL